MRTPSSNFSVGKILRRNEKENRQAANSLIFVLKISVKMKSKSVKPRKIVCRAFCFSPKHQIVKIGEMLHSKIVRRDFFSAEMKNQAIKPRENVRRAFLFFVLNTNLSNEEKSSAKNCPLEMKNVCCQAVKPSFAQLIWLPLTDGTICRAGFRSGTLSADTQPMRERRYARPPPPDLTYSFC